MTQLDLRSRLKCLKTPFDNQVPLFPFQITSAKPALLEALAAVVTDSSNPVREKAKTHRVHSLVLQRCLPFTVFQRSCVNEALPSKTDETFY